MARNSLEQIPLEIQVLNRRAMEMSSHGNYPDALKLFSCVVCIAPHFARAQYEMGRCLDNLVGITRQSKDMTKRSGLIRFLFRIDR